MGKYLLITGVLTVISLIPGMVTLGTMFFFIPGIVLGIAPTLFLYPYVFECFRNRFAERTAYISTAMLLTLIPLTYNISAVIAVATLIHEDKAVASPVSMPDAVVVATDEEAAVCDELCQRFLFNGAVKRVFVISPAPINSTFLKFKARYYYISKQQKCSTPPISGDGASWPNDHNDNFVSSDIAIKLRMADYGCIVNDFGTIGDAGLILTETKIKDAPRPEGWNLAIDSVNARRMELWKNENGVLSLLDRKTQVEFRPLMVPLVIIPWNLVSPLRIPWRVNSYDTPVSIGGHSSPGIAREYTRLFGDAVNKPVIHLNADETNGLLSHASRTH